MDVGSGNKSGYITVIMFLQNNWKFVKEKKDREINQAS